MRKIKTVYERAWAKVAKSGPDECWEWTGAKGKHGHGHIILGGRGSRFTTAHRVIYESANGPIPNGQEVCHSCDNRGCCNPKHLWAGSHKDNMLDMAHKQRSPNQKLTSDQVVEIRTIHSRGKSTFTAIGKLFGVSRVQVKNIVAGKQRIA